MDVTVSLVLAVRDRAEQLAFCLYTLLHQTAAPADYEIVVVDDGSDHPVQRLLRGFRNTGSVTVLRHISSLGRAAARNTGWLAASGEIVVFLDADILAPPTLVEAHQRLHAAHVGEEPLVVSGCPWLWRTTFTVDYPEFDPDRRAALRQPAPPDRPTALMGPEQAAELPAIAFADEAEPLRAFAPTAAPFLAFVTRDVSVRRRVLKDTGGFWEGVRRYGLADWELGYRLYRSGARFVGCVEAACLHQEHPTSPRRSRDNARNYALVLERHPDPEIALMALCPPWQNQNGYARLCTAYHSVRSTSSRWVAELDAVLVNHARRWAAWAVRGSGPPPTCTPPPPRDAQAALACWHAWRQASASPLLEALGMKGAGEPPHAALGAP